MKEKKCTCCDTELSEDQFSYDDEIYDDCYEAENEEEEEDD